MTVKEGQKNPWRETPLIESTNLSRAAGCRIFLKLENVQPSGSFKSRGLGLRVQRSLRNAQNPHKVHFFSSSGGNAGLGCVYAANFVRRPATVVVPMSTKPHMIPKIHAAGAHDVVQHGASWREADAYMRETVMKAAEDRGEEPVYIPPFDHPDIWEGHSWMMDELRMQFQSIGEGAPDWVVCSCGGGGLLAGVMQGLERQVGEWEKTKVLAMETEGADALAKSLEAGENVTLPGITSIATSLGAVRIAEQVYQMAEKGYEQGTLKSAVLSDAEAAMGCWRLADDEKILVEAACGVNIALCYGNRLQKALGRKVRKNDKILIIVCGGSNVSTSIVEGWRSEYGHLTNDTVNARESADDGINAFPTNGHMTNGYDTNSYAFDQTSAHEANGHVSVAA